MILEDKSSFNLIWYVHWNSLKIFNNIKSEDLNSWESGATFY